ncbi:hypothetical protein ACF09Y_22545 [Streptomyces massasporeus]|uniref:hypothetical protein n=1 Tax=Streptomyces massasporeus TaxID=67324 RepID=UPI0036F850FE
MKGREAARAANRRTAEAQAEAEGLRGDLARERADRKAETDALRTEIKRLKAGHIAEASRLAAEEVTRRLAQVEAERRARGLSDDITVNNLYLKDKFVLNACRYISMTTGQKPLNALAMVMTWMTNEDFYGFKNPEVIVKLGLPSDGWVARTLRHYKHDLKRVTSKRIKNGDAWAISLDHAYEEGHPGIHPDYKPDWYPNAIYQGFELVDEPARPETHALAKANVST